ncbi:hypothetical protein E3N88_35235 [Mikania micrantha]|uniref:Uncharacterized protein n=1 Tax=Mikania micrantha TaxID=192012 RepID=A0A5N6M0E0_9ASTR|nr:hypothetical protein E3N88_35235 [Mikania micrantha]
MNMRRFTCQSFDATSCMVPDCRSVTIRGSSDQTLVDHTRLLSNTKYIRLAERRGYVLPASRRPSSTAANSVIKLDQKAIPLSTSNHVFQAGVTSFSIDLETKRVIVMGHVSPVAVLESISKATDRARNWERRRPEVAGGDRKLQKVGYEIRGAVDCKEPLNVKFSRKEKLGLRGEGGTGKNWRFQKSVPELYQIVTTSGDFSVISTTRGDLSFFCGDNTEIAN